jgi:hypothetical protein
MKKDKYESPNMKVVGQAESLTGGGYYNDYDSPGVRKTTNNTKGSVKRQAEKQKSRAGL